MIDVTPWLCSTLVSPLMQSGQLARLKRSRIDQPVADYWWLLALAERQKLNRKIHDDNTRTWIQLVKLLALLTPGARGGENSSSADDTGKHTAHNPSVAFGKALFECGDAQASRAGFSELRLAALLDSEGQQFEEKLTRACRLLATKQQRFNCCELAQCIQFSSGSQGYESTRNKIARDYYRRAASNKTEEVNA